jgi:hypothetical protein
MVAEMVETRLLELLELPIQVVEVAEQVALVLHTTVALVVQVTHELLIGVNYGTTLCIS